MEDHPMYKTPVDSRRSVVCLTYIVKAILVIIFSSIRLDRNASKAE